ITVTAPLKTPSLLEVSQFYAIVDQFAYNRKQRLASFRLGYYVHEAASLPDSQAAFLRLSLPVDFSFVLPPAQIGLLGDPTEVLEAYAHHELTTLLGEGATIEHVA
ncbi:hypothetical protein, partial [Hymenobacter crusticola]